MVNWKDLISNRERRPYPEVVVPLARGSPPKSKETTDVTSTDSSDRASLQENGTSGANPGTTLTLESLRAEIESDLSTSGHDSAYDRTFIHPKLLSLVDVHVLHY